MSSPPDSNAPQPWLLPLLRARFFWLLFALVIFILFSGEVITSARGLWESFLSLLLILLAATHATRSGMRRRYLMAVLCILLFAGWAFDFVHPHFKLAFASYILFLVCLALSVFWTLEFVLRSGTIGADHILGAICAYILIAMIFATIFTMQLRLDPDAFKGLTANGTRPWGELLYFSFTTLSTVGYGDIIPANFHSRSVCMVEQLTGTFYLAILIARLASLYAAPKKS